MENLTESNVWRSLTRVELSLGLLGLIPFLYTSLSFSLPWGITPEQAFVTYSAIILTFLSGTLWQVDRLSSLFSNAIVLMVVAVMVFPFAFSNRVLLLMLLYLLLLAWELLRCRAQYSLAYQGMRCGLTLVVVLCHGLMVIR